MEKKFGITSRRPTRQTPTIRTDLQGGHRRSAEKLQHALWSQRALAAAAVTPALASLTGSPLPRTSVMVPRDTLTLTPCGDLDLDSSPSLDLGDLADDAAAGDDRVAARDCDQHLAVLLHLLLLRPNDQEVEDDEDQDERHQRDR